MKRFWGTLFLLSTISLSSLAQKTIQGKVLDKKNEGAIEMATVRLLNPADSSLVLGGLTDERGSFSLSKIVNGDYILEVRFLGYNRGYRNITMAGKSILLKNIYMEESENLLKAVEVKGMSAQMTVKGDTIEFNSAAFKTAENSVVEELLKKLPGVVVDTDGNITVNGQAVKKIRVDGKKFFGDDVQMATKNIPVDMIDKVQVVDQKSDMAKLTGFEDDNTERIINLTTKSNRKKGIFGNLSVGGGSDKDGVFRYDVNEFLNILNGGSQTAVISGTNNVNSQRSGRGRGGMSGGNGITETQNIGVNNNTELSKTLKIGGNGSYNHSSNAAESSSERESYLNGVTDLNNSTSKSTRDNKQANLRLEMEWNPDTLTTMILQPELGSSKNASTSQSNNTYFRDGDSISTSNSNNYSTGDDMNASLRVILNRKSLAKKGRSFSLNAAGSLSNSNSDGKNRSEKIMRDSTSLIDQRTENLSNSFNTDFRASVVEPLWDLRNFLELAASFRSNTRSSDRLQYNDLNGDGIYSDLDTEYSNNFENSFYNEALELNFRHQAETYNYMLGIKSEPSQTLSKTFYKDGSFLKRENNVVNYTPSAQFRYNFGRKKFARLEYRGRTSQPSIEQMQPVKNNNNLMYETFGNPTLNPSFNQSLNLMYSSFNETRLSSFSFGINGSYTLNALVSNSIYDATGKQYNQTVNAAKTPFNGSANIMFNTPLIKNRLQFNTNTSVSYGQRFGYSDRSGVTNPVDLNGNLMMGQLSQTETTGASENLGLTFTTDVIEVGMRGNVRYSGSQNNLNNDKNQETMDYTGSGNINLRLPYSFTISNDMNYTSRVGYSAFTKDEWVWNASIDKTILQKKGTISLKFFDLLQQKLNVRENIGDNYRELVRSNQLTSYFMLSFTYKLAKFGGSTTGADMFRGGGRSRPEGGFGGRGGDHDF